MLVRLINHRIPFDDAPRAYGLLSEEKEWPFLEYENSTESKEGQTMCLKEKESKDIFFKTFDNA